MNVKEQIAAGTGHTNGKPHTLTLAQRYYRLMDRARMAERQERRSATSGWAREAEQCRELAAAFRGPAFREIYATGDRDAARAFARETGLLTFPRPWVYQVDKIQIWINGVEITTPYPGPLPDPQPQPKLEP